MIFTLSVYGVARMLLYIIAVYFIIKILSRIFAPILIRFAARKMEQKFGQQFNAQQRAQQPKQKEGETVIDKMPSRDDASNKNVGEYIDYEEID
ncbi:DUF4834 family protein [Winogradskyella jejuensis]|uniref:DUF4834 domain-containing protein n=1 Tax=Winogradskyella jejuensis TaxID=1089305 RepID=A0A1M5UHJ6_9FLAO|nr:DUF4834 family protein [Winogradskyella jejuensis]SHH62447.1 protein of unknown function [Winogradskyella jejuensis]